jgi:cytochrome P450
MGGGSIIRVDPPRHIQLRRTVNRVFTPKFVAQLQEKIEDLADQALEGFDRTGTADFVQLVAVPISSMFAICDMLGVPREDRSAPKRWTDAMTGLSDAKKSEDLDRVATSNAEMTEYFDGLLEERSACPREDLLSLMISAVGRGAFEQAESCDHGSYASRRRQRDNTELDQWFHQGVIRVSGTASPTHRGPRSD